MSKNSIKLLRKTNKKELLGLIARAKVEYDTSSDKLLPRNAGTKPAFVTGDMTLTYTINLFVKK